MTAIGASPTILALSAGPMSGSSAEVACRARCRQSVGARFPPAGAIGRNYGLTGAGVNSADGSSSTTAGWASKSARVCPGLPTVPPR